MLLVPCPTATISGVFAAIPRPSVENTVDPNPVHTFPSVDHATVLGPLPTATQRSPVQVTLYPIVNTLVPIPVQFVPVTDQAILFVPSPTATNKRPLKATSYAAVENNVFPRPNHTVPLLEYARVLSLPSPTATNTGLATSVNPMDKL